MVACFRIGEGHNPAYVVPVPSPSLFSAPPAPAGHIPPSPTQLRSPPRSTRGSVVRDGNEPTAELGREIQEHVKTQTRRTSTRESLNSLVSVREPHGKGASGRAALDRDLLREPPLAGRTNDVGDQGLMLGRLDIGPKEIVFFEHGLEQDIGGSWPVTAQPKCRLHLRVAYNVRAGLCKRAHGGHELLKVIDGEWTIQAKEHRVADHWLSIRL